MFNNLEKCYNSKEEVVNFFKDYIEMLSDANYDVKQNETTEKRTLNINTKTNASKITIFSCASKSR